jgi:hypothetical protein
MQNLQYRKDTSFVIVFPEIGPTYFGDTAYFCVGDQLIYDGIQYPRAGIYTNTLTNHWGCDSIVTVDIRVINTLLEKVEAIICDKSYYLFNGDTVRQTSMGELSYGIKSSLADCDSVLYTLYLTVYPSLEVELGDYLAEIGEESSLPLPYTILQGLCYGYAIEFDEKALNAGLRDTLVNKEIDPAVDLITINFPPAMRPGHYTANLIFINEECGNVIIPIAFTVKYCGIITQRWNDILGVLNAEYNGGYEFSTYQWYKDGIPIPNATNYYYYSAPDSLDFNAKYTVALTRIDDGETVISCEYTPEALPDSVLSLEIYVFPTAVPDGTENINVVTNISGVAVLYNTMGVKISQENLMAGENQFPAPRTKGLYILQVRTANNTVRAFRISVE